MHGLAIMSHGAAVALGEDAGHMLFRLGAERNGEALAEQSVVAGGIGDDAAASGEYEAGILSQHGFQCLAFHAAITARAVEVKDNGEGEARISFDLLVEFDEGDAKDLSEKAAERGLAGAAQADQGDSEAAGSGISATEFFEQEFVSISQLGRRKFFEQVRGLFKWGRSRLAVGDKIFDREVQRASD